MAFVNEYIPEADRKRFGITSDSRFYLVGTTNWTVDRERDMFLLRRQGGGPESTPIHYWAFHWRGHLLDARLEVLERGGDPSGGGHGWARIKLHSLNGIEPEIANRRDEILADLQEALAAHKGMGIHSTRTSYEVRLEV